LGRDNHAPDRSVAPDCGIDRRNAERYHRDGQSSGKDPQRESRLIDQQSTVELTALTLYESDQPDLARKYLTDHSHTEAMNGLRLVEALSSSIETRTKVIHGIRLPNRKPW